MLVFYTLEEWMPLLCQSKNMVSVAINQLAAKMSLLILGGTMRKSTRGDLVNRLLVDIFSLHQETLTALEPA